MSDTRNVYALFWGDGIPVINAWDFDAQRLSRLASDRRANEEAFSGEHIRWMPLVEYNRVLRENGFEYATVPEINL